MDTKELILNYVNSAPVVKCVFIDGQGKSTEKELQAFKDKKMRTSLAKAIRQNKFDIQSTNLFTILTASICVPIKDGVRGDDTIPVYVQTVKFITSEVKAFNNAPKEEQRTAKEQADFLFGQLIESIGGEEWINEVTWQAKIKDIIHNNNKGNVAYTRLRLILKRCHNIYKNFAEVKE